jgi:hypothetical protein
MIRLLTVPLLLCARMHGVIAENMREQSRNRFRLFRYAALGE